MFSVGNAVEKAILYYIIFKLEDTWIKIKISPEFTLIHVQRKQRRIEKCRIVYEVLLDPYRLNHLKEELFSTYNKLS